MTEQAILEQLQSMQAEMQKIRQENQILREQQSSQNQIGASLLELTAQLKAQNSKKDRGSMIDIKGLGRPKIFDNSEASFPVWSKKFVDFIASVHPRADVVME